MIFLFYEIKYSSKLVAHPCLYYRNEWNYTTCLREVCSDFLNWNQLLDIILDLEMIQQSNFLLFSFFRISNTSNMFSRGFTTSVYKQNGSLYTSVVRPPTYHAFPSAPPNRLPVKPRITSSFHSLSSLRYGQVNTCAFFLFSALLRDRWPLLHKLYTKKR